jgi:CHAT domain-containing protein
VLPRSKRFNPEDGQWNINHSSTPLLMKSFMTNLRSYILPEALRRAMLNINTDSRRFEG